jgi:hypothetical protein
VSSTKDALHARESAAAYSGDSFALGHQIDRTRVEPEVNVGMFSEGFVVEAREVWFGAPAREISFELAKLRKR